MDRLATIVKRILDAILLPTFIIIVFLGIIRSGPVFCVEGLPCLLIQPDTFLIGYVLSIPAATFYEVLAFWATLIGLLDIVLSFNKKAIPDLILDVPDLCMVDKSRHTVEVSSGTFPLMLNLHFLVKNNGNLSVQANSVGYSVLIPKGISVSKIEGLIQTDAGLSLAPKLKKNPAGFQVLGGEIPTKVYPGRAKRIFSVDLDILKSGTYCLNYYFTTDGGFVPSKIRCDQNNEPVKNLGRIILNVK